MKHFLTYLDKAEPITSVAKRLSKNDSQIWYCMDHRKYSSVCVTSNDLDRYLSLGYTVTCSFLNGTRHSASFGL